jgi:hypothetical protein
MVIQTVANLVARDAYDQGTGFHIPPTVWERTLGIANTPEPQI